MPYQRPNRLFDESGFRRAFPEVFTNDIEVTSTTIATDTTGIALLQLPAIPVGTHVKFSCAIRKTAGAGSAALFGVKINATVVQSTAASGAPASSADNEAQSGIIYGEFYVGDTNYLFGTGWVSAVMSGTGGIHPTITTQIAIDITANIPAAPLTAFTITTNAVGALTVGSKHLRLIVS